MKSIYSSFICLIIFLAFHDGFSQTDQSFIQFSDLSFSNDSEKNAFLEFKESNDNTGVFDLLHCSYDKTGKPDKSIALQRINNSVAYLKTETAGKTEIKKIKIIYDYIHKQFLKVYKLKNSFIDIFETGEYNCVSATALYAIVFDKLSIPYQIRETPEHVYLIAYPDAGKILVETTSPSKGYYQFNTSFVSNFVTNLYQSKIISKEEYESTPVNDLFNKHYFTSESISLLELAGLQFSNFAIYDLEDTDLKNANEEIKKAYFLCRSEKHKFILKSTLQGLLEKNGYEDQENISNLMLLCRFNNSKQMEISNELIENEFEKIIQTQLIKNSDYESFEKSYLKISNELKDSALLNEIGFGYHYELARLGYMNSKNQEYEMKHLVAAYKLNPLNANLRTLILGYFDQSLRKYNDSKSIMDLAAKFSQIFDFMISNDLFLSVKANCILDMAYQSFYLNDLAKGETYLKEFETLVKNNSSTSPTATFVEKAYSQAASEYYRKGNQAKAKQFLKSGLIYAPNSFGLQQRLNQITN